MNSSLALLAAAHEIARKHAVSISNVATRWVLSQSVAAAIIGARLGENEHRSDNLKTFGFALDDEDHARLEAIFATLTPIPADCGDEYRKPCFAWRQPLRSAGRPGAQATYILDKIATSLTAAGSRIEDVVRTRIYLRDAVQWEPVLRAHGRVFARILPANTSVEAKLVGDYAVEIEADAIVSSAGG